MRGRRILGGWEEQICPVCRNGFDAEMAYVDEGGRVAGCEDCVVAAGAEYALMMGVECCPVCGCDFERWDVTVLHERGTGDVMGCDSPGCWCERWIDENDPEFYGTNG